MSNITEILNKAKTSQEANIRDIYPVKTSLSSSAMEVTFYVAKQLEEQGSKAKLQRAVYFFNKNDAGEVAATAGDKAFIEKVNNSIEANVMFQVKLNPSKDGNMIFMNPVRQSLDVDEIDFNN